VELKDRIKDVEKLSALMRRLGLSHLKIGDCEIVRDLSVTPEGPPPSDAQVSPVLPPRRMRKGTAPGSNYENPDLWGDEEAIPFLGDNDEDQAAEANGRRGTSEI